VLPTSRELIAEMKGDVPEQHPAALILRAAFLLATVPDWVLPDTVVTDSGDAGSEVLRDVGVSDITDLVRAELVDRINYGAARYGNRVGPAIDAVARAWWEWQRASRRPAGPGDPMRIEQRRVLARQALTDARAAYTRTRRGTAWIAGPPGPHAAAVGATVASAMICDTDDF
jgi:hypothetical protein